MTAYIRGQMVEKALETSGYAERHRALVETTALYAEKVRQVILAAEGTNDSKLDDRYATLHDVNKSAFLHVSTSRTYHDTPHYNVNIGGLDVYLYLDGQSHSQTGSTHLTEAFKEGQKSGKRCWVPRSRRNVDSEELKQEFMDIESDWVVVAKLKTDVTESVKAAVSQYSTVEKMIAAWPEAKELLPKDLTEPKGTAIALDIKTLNAICGVPTGE